MSSGAAKAGLLNAPTSERRSPLIDLVRAALAIWVVFAHLIPWTQQAQGPAGVSQGALWFMQELQRIFQPSIETHPAVLCFIVLSGYCIHRNGLRRSAFNVRGYAIRRVFRIYPVYLIATLFGVCCFLIATHASPTMGRLLSGTQALSPGCLAAKLALVNAVDPRLLYCVYQGNAPLNTVMAEMGLYAVYPLLLVLALRFSELWLAACVILAWLGGQMVFNGSLVSAYWWNHASVVGFLLYWWVGAKFVDPHFASQVGSRWPWVVAAWLVLTVLILGHATGAVLIVELRKLTLALMFGVLVTRIDTLGMSLPWLLDRIGKAGYSIYAFHAPLVYTLLILATPWWLVFGLAIAAGAVGYAFIERPSIAIGRLLAARRSSPSLLPVPGNAPWPLPPVAVGQGVARGTSEAKELSN